MAKTSVDIVSQLHADERAAWREYAGILQRLSAGRATPADATKLPDLARQLFLPAERVQAHADAVRQALALSQEAHIAPAGQTEKLERAEADCKTAHAQMIFRARELGRIRAFLDDEAVHEKEAGIAALMADRDKHRAEVDALRAAIHRASVLAGELKILAERFPKIFEHIA